MHKQRIILPILAIVALMLASCGGSGSGRQRSDTNGSQLPVVKPRQCARSKERLLRQ